MRNGIVIIILALFCTPVCAQESLPTIRPVRIDNPPRIDGILDDEVWRSLEPITDFRQFDPKVGEPATERTEVRICYDERFLYIAVRANESRPDEIIANIYERDAEMHQDDAFMIAIDSLRDRRTAFMFETNALGTQSDAQISEGKSFNESWDAIWYSRAAIDSEGYSLEVAIPFFVLRFKPREEVEMGILMRRIIRRKNEYVFWPELGRDYSLYNMSQYGTMAGLRGIERGVDLEFKPYAIAGYSRMLQDSEYDADAGLDLKWGVTPNLTADFTFNTDFAQVESDELQLNLTRFSLFYPEKRDFFIENNDQFHVGLWGEVHTFFSRRIGIRGDEEVPILGGARMYGLVGDTNIGFLSIQTRESGGIPGENFSALRIKQNILDRSYIGAILTSRTGYDPERDLTVGGDFVLLYGPDSGFYGALVRSDRPDVSEGNWFGTMINFNFTDRYETLVQYADVGPRFDPGIGFVRRPDQRTITLHGAYKPRPGWSAVRQLFLNGDYVRTYNYGGEVESVVATTSFETKFESDDAVWMALEFNEDLISHPFEIAPGVVIPPDRYTFSYAGGGFDFNTSRRFSGNIIYLRGEFYGGDITSGGLSVSAKLTPRLQVNGEVSIDDVSLPGGDFTAVISRLYLSCYLSPSFTTRLAAQYLSIFEDFVLNFRLRWIYAPGSEAWLVYDEGRRFDLPGSSLRDRALILKVVHNFNF